MEKITWAEGTIARGELDSQLDAMLGPKTAEDEAPVDKKKGPKKVLISAVRLRASGVTAS